MANSRPTPTISAYASDEQVRSFTANLGDADLSEWARQQKLGATRARLAEDRASCARGAEIARQEIQRRS
ncbi:hypothetical protein [Streptomyces ortus]|uniref:Uncharacterized protein n=1 Tax=Streptomyces ortus TaxID=2867268 RepID=A0ABT3UWV1_9ACTN|nr:hypothetical protein [Streptomyces ortus]MCX4232037.1 hypothetical protein [Streptomyces ortus]